MQRDPVLFEGVRTARHIHPPHTETLLAHHLAQFVEIGFEAPAPLPQRLGVMQAQVLDVGSLQPGIRNFLQGQADMWQLAVRENIAVDEIAPAIRGSV